jgi:RNA polymerase sigma factor (sigma-70 family)
MSRLAEMADSLSPRQRIIFALRYGRHMDIKQTAGRLDCTEGNIRLHLFRSTHKLRRAFAASAPAS